MAKRFIDTDIFKKGFVKSLEAPYKLLWIYILQECNHAGIWEVELEIAAIRLGLKFRSSPVEIFADKITVLDNGSKWFIPSFIEFQYGKLSEKNRAHSSVISILNKYELIDDNLLLKHLTSPLEGGKDMDMEKDKDMEMEKGVQGVERLSDIQTDYTEYPNHILDGWNGFEQWLYESAPRVQKMKYPITIDHYCKHSEKFESEKGKSVFMSMHNRPTLLDKSKGYVDANATFLNWYKRPDLNGSKFDKMKSEHQIALDTLESLKR